MASVIDDCHLPDVKRVAGLAAAQMLALPVLHFLSVQQ